MFHSLRRSFLSSRGHFSTTTPCPNLHTKHLFVYPSSLHLKNPTRPKNPSNALCFLTSPIMSRCLSSTHKPRGNLVYILSDSVATNKGHIFSTVILDCTKIYGSWLGFAETSGIAALSGSSLGVYKCATLGFRQVKLYMNTVPPFNKYFDFTRVRKDLIRLASKSYMDLELGKVVSCYNNPSVEDLCHPVFICSNLDNFTYFEAVKLERGIVHMPFKLCLFGCKFADVLKTHSNKWTSFEDIKCKNGVDDSHEELEEFVEAQCEAVEQLNFKIFGKMPAKSFSTLSLPDPDKKPAIAKEKGNQGDANEEEIEKLYLEEQVHYKFFAPTKQMLIAVYHSLQLDYVSARKLQTKFDGKIKYFTARRLIQKMVADNLVETETDDKLGRRVIKNDFTAQKLIEIKKSMDSDLCDSHKKMDMEGGSDTPNSG